MSEDIKQMNNSQIKMSFKEEIFDLLDTSVTTIVIALLCFTFVFSLSTIKQSSMFPTLRDNDKVIVYGFMYKPKYGDVIVITQPNYLNHNLVKRVIALEGQTVYIDPIEKKVFVDGKELNEPYIYEPTAVVNDIKYPVTVPKNCMFCMGDNRNGSLDSRSSSIGMIDRRYVRGKVIFRIWPFNRFGVIK